MRKPKSKKEDKTAEKPENTEKKKPEWKDESSQNGTGTILYRVFIRNSNSFSAPFSWQGHIITNEWHDSGKMYLEIEGIQRGFTDYRTERKHGYMPFTFNDTGLFDYEAAMAWAFWCETNIKGKYSDSKMDGRVEAALCRIRVTYSVKLERELTLHALPRELAFKSFMEEMEHNKKDKKQ